MKGLRIWRMACVSALIVLLALFADMGVFALDAQTAPESAPLRQGDRGETVYELQRALTAMGFLTDAPDGIYGEKTRGAVAAFQESAALEKSGEADAATLQALYGAYDEIDAGGEIVVAPYSGQRFHASEDCWGLENARDTERVTRLEAVNMGKTPCKICYDGAW